MYFVIVQRINKNLSVLRFVISFIILYTLVYLDTLIIIYLPMHKDISLARETQGNSIICIKAWYKLPME